MASSASAQPERRPRAIVTGGAGFIGHHLVRALQDRGDEVLVVDDLSGAVPGGLRPKTRMERLDITSDDLAPPFSDWRPDVIYHLAAQVSVPRSMSDPERDLAVNVVGTYRVIEAANAADARRLVFVSSGGAIYGNAVTSASETTPPRPMSYYGAHKLLAEHYVRWSGIAHAIARPSNVYGAGQPAGGEGAVIAAFIAAVRKSQPLVIHGDGTQRRDYLHVADLVSALLLVGDETENAIWNVSSGVTTSVLDLVGIFEKIVGQPLDLRHAKTRPGDIHTSSVANDRIKRLGWLPSVSLMDGLGQLLQRPPTPAQRQCHR